MPSNIAYAAKAHRRSKLQDELKKRGRFASRTRQEVVLGLARTSDRLSIRLERLVQAHGLTGSQYNVLRILRGEGKPLPMHEIASRTVQVLAGITGLTDRLEAAGLVRRERSSEDRRVIFVAITDRALGVLAALDAPLVALEKQLLAGLPTGEQEKLTRLLEKIRTHLDKLDAGEVTKPRSRRKTAARL